MRLINLTCPNCNGTLQVNEELSKCSCPYCGADVLVDKENMAEEDIRKIGTETAKAIRNENQDKLIGEWTFGLSEEVMRLYRKRSIWLTLLIISSASIVVLFYIRMYLVIIGIVSTLISYMGFKSTITVRTNLEENSIKYAKLTKKVLFVKTRNSSFAINVSDILSLEVKDNQDMFVELATKKVGPFVKAPKDFLDAIYTEINR